MRGEAATLVFEVGGMHCASCGLLIDDAVEKLAGVVTSSTDARRGRTLVRFDPSAVAPETIVATIEEAGYQARQVEA
jgi:Cu+-exporting ATPase